MPRSEELRELCDRNYFFGACQIKLGHKLPLGAYLLKPIQRITKYQLLLKVRFQQHGNIAYFQNVEILPRHQACSKLDHDKVEFLNSTLL